MLNTSHWVACGHMTKTFASGLHLHQIDVVLGGLQLPIDL